MTRPPDAASQPVGTSTVDLRRNRAYRLLMAGRTLTLTSASMTGLAGVLLAYDLTHDPAAASTIMGLSLIGMLVATLPAGWLADRFDRRTVMITVAVGHAALIASIPVAAWLGILTLTQLAMVTCATGAVSMGYPPAEQAALVQVVATKDLDTALALNQARSSAASITGPPLAGALYSVAGTLPYVADSIANLIAAACAAAIRDDLRPKVDRPRTSVVGELMAGIRFFATHRGLRPLSLVIAMSTVGFWILYTGTVLGLQHRGAPPSQLALLQAGFGVGSLLGALASRLILRRLALGHTIALTLAGLLLVGSGLTLATTTPAAVTLLTLFGATFPVANIGVLTWFVRSTPDGLVGRVTSALGLIALSAAPVGTLVAGHLLAYTNQTIALTAGLAALTAALTVTLTHPAVRTLPRLAR
ncbi:MFS transporter [Streptosporangium sp. CA-115845]|uniref:MFS transporter n=1 Tax=Streptosporangium sp. CA-115845 TaxID=3240071 RepID=UPI003D92B2FF